MYGIWFRKSFQGNFGAKFGEGKVLHPLLLGNCLFQNSWKTEQVFEGDSLKTMKCTLHDFPKTGCSCRCKKHLSFLKPTNGCSSMTHSWHDRLESGMLAFLSKNADRLAQSYTWGVCVCVHFGKCVKERSLWFSRAIKCWTKCNLLFWIGSWNRRTKHIIRKSGQLLNKVWNLVGGIKRMVLTIGLQ